MATPLCLPKPLTSSQAEIAIRRSIEINPANAADVRSIERTPAGRRGGLRRLALLVGNRWPPSGVILTVQFLDTRSKELRAKILGHMNAWSEFTGVSFVETNGTGMVRIARLDHPADMAGYWSYVGTQVLGIEADQPTLNLEGFTMRTSDAEFQRVVRHEAGHTLGFEHEHLRSDLVRKIDRRKAIDYYDRECGWTKEETIEQVLTPLKARSILGTSESDPLSIMCYEIPAEITKNGQAIIGGDDISSNDARFASQVYPKVSGRVNLVRSTDQPANNPPTHRQGFVTQQVADTFEIVILDEFVPEPKRKSSPAGAAKSQSEEKGPRFARVIASYAGARVSGVMRLRAEGDEPPTPYGNIIRIHERIKNFTNQEQGTLPTDRELMKFGSDLFETLLQGDVRRLYDEARTRQQRKLNLIFTSMIPWIAEKPWEFAYDASRQSFLATEEIHFLRNVLTTIPAQEILAQSGPLRILVAAAQPVSLGQLSADQEVEVIRRGFEPLIDAGLVTIDALARTTPHEILKRLATGNFNVVHFIGHGIFDETTEQGTLVFEDENGAQFPLGERAVREIFCKHGISLVFLNSCQSGSGGRHNFNKGVAQAMVSHGLPAVVANQYSVLDSSATSFSKHFYWSLAHGMGIGQAACQARIALNCSLGGEPIDWAVPVVYARDPNLTLCVAPDKIAATISTSVRPASRRAVQGRPVRVAVWDVDSIFPAIESTLHRMNESQDVFGFEMVSLSAPLDAWDLENRAEDGSPYLWAEKVARRLQHLTVELHVNVLACITRHWLRDDNWLNLYGWWPGNKKPPVVIFSCAGFDDLPVEGRETDRAIANTAVSGLTGFLADLDSHERGPKDCPLSFNQDRDLEYLTGPLAFDRACRHKLKQKIPRELPALEAILNTFQ